MSALNAVISVESEFDLSDIVLEGAQSIVSRFQETCAVDTGEMMRSADAFSGGRNKAIVFVGAEHTSFVEYGTRKMDAQPALGPAIDEMLPGIMQRVAEAEALKAYSYAGQQPPKGLSPSAAELRSAAIAKERAAFAAREDFSVP